MSAEAWVAIVAVLIAAVAAYVSWRAEQSANRSARAAENQTKIQEQALLVAKAQTKLQQQAAQAAAEQTEIQRQLRIDAAQPYVWADMRPDDATGTILNLVVGNSGPTLAENIRIDIDPPLPAIDQLRDRADTARARLQDGIRSLAPGRTLVWPLGQGFNLLNADSPPVCTFTVNADGPFGPILPRSYAVDLSDLNGVLDRPDGSLHGLTQAVKELGKKLDVRECR